MLRTICVLTVAVIAAAADNCDPKQCDTPKHYSEIGCIPVTEEGSCCPTRFDCSALSNRQPDKCYYRGVAYNADTAVKSDPADLCLIECRCTNRTARVEMLCINIECPELFQGLPPKGCYRQYAMDKCCSINTACVKPGEKVAECQYGGSTYKDGQAFYPDDEPCKRCICSTGFNGTLAEPWCKEISCSIELHHSRDISDGCVPIYYGTKGCCPIEWRCPEASDNVAVSGNVTTKTSEHKCKFGNLELNVGDQLSPYKGNRCVSCSCKIPPQVTCVQKPHEECT